MSKEINIKASAWPTMITPYNRDGTIDTGAMDALVDWYWEKGCAGIFASCQSSEIWFQNEDERVRIADQVVKHANELASRDKSREPLRIVASGHVSERFDDQVRELTRIAGTGVDAVILISNRLDISNTSDKKWIEDAERLISRIPDVPLGVYECPMPYKRLLNKRILDFCASTGKFRFIKDTCCDAAEIERRVKQLSGTGIELYNANAQTLLSTLRSGAAGYCGVMANFHPELYVWLCSHFEDMPEKADEVQAFLCLAAFTESLAYPVTAKYHQVKHEHNEMNLFSRSRDTEQLTAYHRQCIDQMNLLAKQIGKSLGIR